MAEKENEEKTYEIKDRRRVNPDGTLRDVDEEPKPREPAAEEAPAEEAHAEAPGEAGPELPMPSVYDLLRFMVGMLAEQAWVRMGIRLAPGHKETDKDLAQAKIAIDTIVHIVDTIHPHVTEDQRKALRGLVSDLRINFVRQS